jgi:hypothetical protein
MEKKESRSVEFSRRVEELEKCISGCDKNKSARCIPTMLIMAALVPVVVWVLLFLVQPRFVQKKEGSKSVRDNKRVFYWTLLFTGLVWIAMYGYAWCKGSGLSMVCAVPS